MTLKIEPEMPDARSSRKLVIIATLAVALAAATLITVMPATAAFGFAVAVAVLWCLWLEHDNERD